MRYSVIAEKAIHSILLDVARAGDRMVAVGDRGHILYSDDSGANWTQAKVPTQQMLTATSFPTPKVGWAVGHDAVILKTVDGGETWVKQYDDPDAEVPFLDVWFKDDLNGFAIGAYGYFLRTEDGGTTWDEWKENIDNVEELHLNAMIALGDGTLLIAGEQGTLYRSTDEGAYFEALESPYDGSFFGAVPSQKPESALVFGLRGHLFRTDDTGDSWQQVDSGTEQGLFAGRLLGDGSQVIVGDSGNILISRDDGNSVSLTSRANRLLINGIEQAPDGGWILVGQGGAHRVLAGGSDRKPLDN
ncbi:WD40/YVTN/BNR-like repeat-containing protein [Aestuariirhabdus litorea]|uniref:WD40/YVTN/BNR-like repeat-containing protein n=1 Tax=Aestuariirhabdus litorea TaxID=2528527 RepID=UPI001A9EA968|nr:YCF48-related protein [Aestuariirhabdus litorea]